MEQITPQNWAIIHIGLIFMITCANMVVVYALSDASNPTPGLGLYTVYFMAALLGWIAHTLKQVADIPMPVDVPSVAAVLNGYILYLAVGQRAGITAGRYILGLVCLGVCLSLLFLREERLFSIQNATAALFFTASGALAATRAWRRKNVGDGLTAFATLLMAIGVPLALYQLVARENPQLAHTIAFGAHSSAYILVAIGFLASVVVEYQQHLSHLATEDPLTRLLNRRGLEKALQVPLAHAARQQLPTSAIMLDIDRFKEVNDNFGHDVGDKVIRRVAEHLQHMSRASDVVARTGGEEFLLILPQTTLDAARTLAERIRRAIAEQPLIVDRQEVPVTVSLGVATMMGGIDVDKLSQDADRAMYLAKRGGCNRVASVESTPIHLSTHAGTA
jgi:diguanylate cyclase (GGDEF)-like protein